MRLPRLLLLGMLFALAAASPAQSLRDAVTVEVVDVPVYVTRDGKPVEGLTGENFELYVNGKRQPIDYFDAMAPADAPSSLRERRLFLLLFDVAFTHPLSLGRAQRAAREAIAASRPGDYFAVATYSMRRGVWFAAPFTRDREALTRAIASLGNTRSGDPLSIVLTPAERMSAEQWEGEVEWTQMQADPRNLASRIAAETLREIGRARMFHAAGDQILDLADLSERLGALDGQKHIVMLSEGFEGRAPNPSDVRVPYSTTRSADARPADAGIPDHSLAARIIRMHRTFQQSGVFLHALDLEGVANSLVGSSSLSWLTSGTGGRYVHSRNDFGRALTELSANLGRGYRLGFRPAGARRGYNSIRVRVVDAGNVRVDHRRGFAGSERAETDDGLYLADVVLNDVPQSGTAAALELRDGKLTARIPMAEVAAQLAKGGEAELLVYGFGADGTALAFHRTVVAVAAGATGEKTIELTMPEGTAVAKALLRVERSLGFSRVVR